MYIYFIKKLKYLIDYTSKKFLKIIIPILPKKIIEFLIINISKSKKKSLEITATIGCAMMCSYCPQKHIFTTYSLPKLLFTSNWVSKLISSSTYKSK